MPEGRVFRSTGSWYEVLTEENIFLPCRTAGKMRLNDTKATNPIAVGDYVIYEKTDKEETGIISEVKNRENYVIRQSPRKKHLVHIIASNIDQALLIVTMRNPGLKQGFIDRFLLMTEPFNIPVYIVFNKGDIYTDDDLEYFEHLKEIYQKIGYTVFISSALENKGIKQIEKILTNKTTLLSGQSGVGKSSILNAIDPDLDQRIGILSEYTGKGQHTTTFAEMFTLALGGYIIDTPGLKTLSYNFLEVKDVAHNFKEFFEASSGCKFADCLHRNEPKCAVKKAVENGEISELRYQNYKFILEEIEEQNYWERH